MLIIPKILAVNAAKDATDLIARLRNHHAKAQTDATMKQYSYLYFVMLYIIIFIYSLFPPMMISIMMTSLNVIADKPN